MQKAIEASDVSMIFNMSKEKVENIKEYVIKLVRGELRYNEFTALDSVSFSVDKGEIFGVIGLNGSGKSTLLKLLAGIMKPTSGTVKTHGSISPLIELGAGFNMELTARENIYLSGSVLGYGKKFLDEKFDEIIDFSEISQFVDVPMKNYSSGMVARIAFSVATVVKPEILICDEVLAVGDFQFQAKCEKRLADMMSGGTTVVIVSHSIAQIRKLCSRALWLEHGKAMQQGATDAVCSAYENR